MQRPQARPASEDVLPRLSGYTHRGVREHVLGEPHTACEDVGIGEMGSEAFHQILECMKLTQLVPNARKHHISCGCQRLGAITLNERGHPVHGLKAREKHDPTHRITGRIQVNEERKAALRIHGTEDNIPPLILTHFSSTLTRPLQQTISRRICQSRSSEQTS